MPKGNGGFTLVELLVVILIIVILSVTMLPLLKPFVTKAQYAAEAVPVIGNLRTKIELFRIEKDHLPGILTADGKPSADVEIASTDVGAYYQSRLVAGTTAGGDIIQSILPDTTDNNTLKNYAFTYNDVGTDRAKAATMNLPDHVFRQIDVDYADLTGKRLRPQHVQYVVLGNGKSNGDKCLWALGAFGDGAGLAKGCGYAVLECNNPDTKLKFVATFERYKATKRLSQDVDDDDEAQLTFGGPGVGDNTKPDVDNYPYCYLPSYEALMSTEKGTVDGELTNMRNLGWSVEVDTTHLTAAAP